jgi:uncharacterized protein
MIRRYKKRLLNLPWYTWFSFLLFYCFTNSAYSKISEHAFISDNSSLINFINGAKEQTKRKVSYDPSYCRIAYPGGDIPSNKGVCTDFVIRAFRNAGIDLQKEVYEHMQSNANLYSLKRFDEEEPDPSIEHRRIINLIIYFKNKALELPVTKQSNDYRPGDIVIWKINQNLHMGIVVDIPSKRCFNRFMIAHHSLKSGPKVQDLLFAWKMIGHYRYFQV